MGARNDRTSTDFLKARGYDEINDSQFWRRDFYFDHMMWELVLSGGNALRKRMALALSEIFVVSVNDLDVFWPVQAVGAYWDLLNEHAFGNYRDLLEAVTLSPAMGAFLDTLGNEKADSATGRVPDENFAREIMQLFTIGLVELNADGTPRTSAGTPIETYTNTDVEGLAKVFTGFSLDYSGVDVVPNPKAPRQSLPSVQVVRQPMAPIGDLHSMDAKSFLGTTIVSGTGAMESLEIALDTLFNHPNVGPFIGRQLIQRLVTSNPSPDYIRRVATVFNDNGDGERGDLGAVFRAVVLDPEATSVDGLTSWRHGKLREPMLRFAQWGQTFGAKSASGTWEIRNLAQPDLLNQVPFRPPSVFNFFRPDFTPGLSQAAANGMVLPEFQIVDETSVAGYINFIRGAIEGGAFWAGDIAADYSAELALADEPLKLLDHLDLILSAGQLRESTRSLILEAIEDVKIAATDDDRGRARRIWLGIMLIMASNDYLTQK